MKNRLMQRIFSSLVVAVIALSIAAPATAQRGGGGRSQGMGRDRGFSSRDMVNSKFDTVAPGIGESMPDITVYDDAGNSVSLEKLFAGHYSVVVLGCLTSPPFLSKVSRVETIFRDYGPEGVEFFYVYKSLAHPELNGYVEPVTLDERLLHIEEAKRALGTEIAWIADNMDNELKRALGDVPNAELVIDPEGKVAARRAWSDPSALRADLEKLVGPVADPTSVADLDMPVPAYYEATVATGVVPRVQLSGRTLPLLIELTDSVNDLPAYAKLRVEAEPGVLEQGKGQLHLGFHLDPIYRVHWNNLAPQPEFSIAAPNGVELDPAAATFPKVEEEADADPREFLVEIDTHRPPREGEEPLELTVTYYACDNDNTWCIPVTQSYEISLVADPDGGRTFGRGVGGRIGGRGSRGRAGGGRGRG